jgi:hypothetical protein
MLKQRVTKTSLQLENEGLLQEIRVLRNEASSLNKIPKLDQSIITTLVIALEKTTECVAHVLSDMKAMQSTRRN